MPAFAEAGAASIDIDLPAFEDSGSDSVGKLIEIPLPAFADEGAASVGDIPVFDTLAFIAIAVSVLYIAESKYIALDLVLGADRSVCSDIDLPAFADGKLIESALPAFADAGAVSVGALNDRDLAAFAEVGAASVGELSDIDLPAFEAKARWMALANNVSRMINMIVLTYIDRQ